MAKKPRVPKFGDWDSENISYTACFDNARKDGVRRNPNDPEENPEAFKGMFDSTSYGTKPRISSENLRISIEKSQKNEVDCTGHRAQRRDNGMNEHKGIVGGRKSNTSESGSERSNSDYAISQQQQSRNKREASDRRKSLAASSGSDHSTSQSQSKHKSGGSSHNSSSHLSHDTHTRVASIPKFGDWDEKDPQSGEGFTYIFEQIKEEKKTAAKFPFPQDPIINAYKPQKSSSKSKICCCISPSAKE